MEVPRARLGAWGSVQAVLRSAEMIQLRTRIKVALAAISLLGVVLLVVYLFAASFGFFLLVAVLILLAG